MKKKVLYTIGTLIGIAIFAFGYYAISPLFINIKIDEKVPVMKESINSPSAFITGTTGHPASGTVRILLGENVSYLRYENFKTINGPDLYIYLSKDLNAKEYVNLGTLRATEGNVNYEIPRDTNLAEYKYAMVWCKKFGVLFNYADISKTIKQ